MYRFSVWAPYCSSVAVEVVGNKHSMYSADHGYWTIEVEGAEHGSDYLFYLDEDLHGYPDPRSSWQPHGVHGASRIFDHHRFQWTDEAFAAVPLADAVIYELHVGTFTSEGTFRAAEDQLEALRTLGITHVELMPLNSFAGSFGWGYDGVSLFAPQEAYGGPEPLQHFVNACHAHGMAVIIDVVYNHFGPVGNYTGKFGPYLTENHRTPWGGAVNLEEGGSTEVRRFFCDNALMWLRDYHFDGLRLDAIQTYIDRSATYFLEQLSQEVDSLSTQLGRPLVMIAESDLNDPRVVTPRATTEGDSRFGYGMNAQWSDDFHHALFAFLTGQRKTYYADFGSLSQLAKALHSVFVYDGLYSEHRGRIHGRPAGSLNRTHFLGYIQNHDQVGNQAFGDRLYPLVGQRKAMLAAAMVLTSPFVPMLFQGEEFAAATPFLYFAQHDDQDIARSVSEGRRQEHAHEGDIASIPDPVVESTFLQSKLHWQQREQGHHAEMLDWYRSLIHLRQTTPGLRDGNPANLHIDFDEEAQWLVMRRSAIELWFNFSDVARTVTILPQASLTLSSDAENKLESATLTLCGTSFAAVTIRQRVEA
jgi:maltooligosyltrehalose trehalohydrolase